MLVLDANILIRAVLGSKVLSLLRKYAGQVEFLAPDMAFDEAREHLPSILERRNVHIAPAIAALDLVAGLVLTVEPDTYSRFEALARQIIEQRDEEDWPVLASALTLNCPIWTEDTDFFGCGVATWTTDRVEVYEPAAFPGPEQQRKGYVNGSSGVKTVESWLWIGYPIRGTTGKGNFWSSR